MTQPIIKRSLIKLPAERCHNNNSAWQVKDDESLRDALTSGYTAKEISELLGRSITSIYTRKSTLTDQGFIKRGVRLSSPKGVLRKGGTVKTERPETRESEALLKKWKTINEKSTVAGIKVHQQLADAVEKNATVAPNPYSQQAKLYEDLAAIVKSHGVTVIVTTQKAGTEITIKN